MGLDDVFFIQERVGKGGELFPMIKFRTMAGDMPTDPEFLKQRFAGECPEADAERTSLIASVARQFCLDELPQLVNFVRGDMSFVGFRPCTPDSFRLFPDDVREASLANGPGLIPGELAYRKVDGDVSSRIESMRRFVAEKAEIDDLVERGEKVEAAVRLTAISIRAVFNRVTSSKGMDLILSKAGIDR